MFILSTILGIFDLLGTIKNISVTKDNYNDEIERQNKIIKYKNKSKNIKIVKFKSIDKFEKNIDNEINQSISSSENNKKGGINTDDNQEINQEIFFDTDEKTQIEFHSNKSILKPFKILKPKNQIDLQDENIITSNPDDFHKYDIKIIESQNNSQRFID